MVCRVAEVVRDVRVALDRNNSGVQLLETGDVDTLSLDEIIGGKVAEAVRLVELAAPAHLLEEGHLFGESVYWNGDGSGWTLLPEDFMRLVAFRMSDWERTVYGAVSVDDPRYLRQSSRYGGIRGNVQKPVCAIVHRAEGKALEFYSCLSEDAYVSRASYVPYPRVDEYGGIDISERCYEAVVYMSAALAMVTMGDMEKATAMRELSKTYLE